MTQAAVSLGPLTYQMPPSVVAMYGPPGSLKTSIALSWPKKIALYDFDFGAHRAWGLKQIEGDSWAFNGEPVVYMRRLPLPHRSFTQRFALLEGFIEFWGSFISSMLTDCENPEIQTIILDTATIEWSICCDAYLQELQEENITKRQDIRKQLQQIEYGEPNRRQKQIFDMVKSAGKNLVVVHHETDEYIPLIVGGVLQKDEYGRPVSIQTGKKVPDGFKYTLKICDWELYSPEKQEFGYYCLVIRKSAMGIDLMDTQIGGIRHKGKEDEEVVYATYGGLVERLRQLERI